MERQLTQTEIDALIRNNCQAENWSALAVPKNFNPGAVWNCAFSGRVDLGCFQGDTGDANGVFSPVGLFNCRLHNVRVGDNCRIADAEIADTDIDENCRISKAAVSREGPTAFAVNHPVHVLAEDGAREVPLWPRLSAQIAHLLCHLQKHPACEKIHALIEADAAALRDSRNRIGPDCRIEHSGQLTNVLLGAGTRVEYAAKLHNCLTVDATANPARILEGVRAENTVFLAGSRTDGGTRLDSCLVGEGVVLDRNVFAKHSLFFANSEFHLCEAACAMAGPFAVSHHRATLVLTCQSSFNTFGSAANSSNHHFKLGPRHGGVLRRGARCGSGSYLFWPSDIGAFTTVVGKHQRHLDTQEFPFSLLLEKNGDSVLIPGVNLFAAGVTRDGIKWPLRERRHHIPRPLDCVNTAVFSPYVMQAMENGARMLKRSANHEGDMRHNGAIIPSGRVEPALRLYEAAMDFYIGDCLLKAVLQAKPGVKPVVEDFLDVMRQASAGIEAAGGQWRDWGGMLLSGRDAGEFLADAELGRLADGEAILSRLHEIHAAYPRRELAWAVFRWRREYGTEAEGSAVADFMEKWRAAVNLRYECLMRDVSKEFRRELMYGFGIEGDPVEEFRQVRGGVEDVDLLAQARAERDACLDLVVNVK